jgi:hypothetical protein
MNNYSNLGIKKKMSHDLCHISIRKMDVISSYKFY